MQFYIAAMEAVLDVYIRPRDPLHPLVCFDEASKQLIKETRIRVAMKKGYARRKDYEYERNGTVNMFMMFAPLKGWRNVKVTDRHTAIDYAHALKDLSDTHFPNAKKLCWCKTTSIHIKQLHCTKPSHLLKHAVLLNASNGYIPPNTAVG